MKLKAKMKGMTLKILVRCMGCKATKTVGPEQREQPLCERCGMPMIVESIRSGR